MEANGNDQRRAVRISELLPLGLSKISLQLSRDKASRRGSGGCRHLRSRKGPTTHGEIVEGSPGTAFTKRPGHEELSLHYPEMTIRTPVVQETRHSRGTELEGVPCTNKTRLARMRLILEESPVGVLCQRNVGRGCLIKAPNTPTPMAITRTSHTTSAKGSPSSTCESTTSPVTPRHFISHRVPG